MAIAAVMRMVAVAVPPPPPGLPTVPLYQVKPKLVPDKFSHPLLNILNDGYTGIRSTDRYMVLRL
jgi:hypothetical protein